MPVARQAPETRVVLDNVSWQTFETLVADTGPRRGRMAYEEGTLEILSPSSEHEILNCSIACLLEAFCQELGIDMLVVGSTTLKLEMKLRGAEPDKSYYVQNEARVRGKLDIELGRDLPPDLAIEIQLTRSALNKLGIYAALGVPELWFWETDRLRVFSIGEGGTYEERDQSQALPGLPIGDLLRFVELRHEKSTTRLVNEFRAWVREHCRKGA